jgi:hypothetical protein
LAIRCRVQYPTAALDADASTDERDTCREFSRSGVVVAAGAGAVAAAAVVAWVPAPTIAAVSTVAVNSAH